MAETPASPALKPPGQPFTFRGVARFAFARPVRLFGTALIFALLGGFSAATILSRCWSPAISEAIGKLPEQSVISAGRLYWPKEASGLLAANPFISFSVTKPGSEIHTSAADLAFEFESDQLTLRSFLGGLSFPYPGAWKLDFNRTTLLPIWGAWEKPLIPLAVIGIAIALVVSWSLLAILYAFPVRLLSAIGRKNLTLREAWKLSLAAQWFGGLILSFFLILYALGQTNLFLLCAAFILHFAVTFTFLVLSPFWLPRIESVNNPFSTRKKSSRRGPNPFRSNTPDDDDDV